MRNKQGKVESCFLIMMCFLLAYLKVNDMVWA